MIAENRELRPRISLLEFICCSSGWNPSIHRRFLAHRFCWTRDITLAKIIHWYCLETQPKSNMSCTKITWDFFLKILQNVQNHTQLSILIKQLDIQFQNFPYASRGVFYLVIIIIIEKIRCDSRGYSCDIAFSIFLRARTYGNGNMRINCGCP